MTNTEVQKWCVQVAIPLEEGHSKFHNFVEFLNEEGQLRCCDDIGVFTVYDTYIEAREIAKQISKFHYIVEITEYVT